MRRSCAKDRRNNQFRECFESVFHHMQTSLKGANNESSLESSSNLLCMSSTIACPTPTIINRSAINYSDALIARRFQWANKLSNASALPAQHQNIERSARRAAWNAFHFISERSLERTWPKFFFFVCIIARLSINKWINSMKRCWCEEEEGNLPIIDFCGLWQLTILALREN